MTISDLKFEIANSLRELDTHNTNVYSKKLYNQRMKTLKKLLAKIEKGIEEFNDPNLDMMRDRVQRSISIMETVNAIGVINKE